MKKLSVIGTLITLVGGAAVSVNANVYYDIGTGTAAPPPTLGGYSMVGLSGENLAFSSTDAILIEPGNVPTDWTTWSHGDSGTVYTAIGASDLTLTLPTGALAFYLYIEPNSKGTYDFTVTSGSATTPLSINGDGGARYVGFYSDIASDPLVSITVSQADGTASGFAAGEFGINGVPTVPDTASCLNIIAAIGSLGLAGWRCRRS